MRTFVRLLGFLGAQTVFLTGASLSGTGLALIGLNTPDADRQTGGVLLVVIGLALFGLGQWLSGLIGRLAAAILSLAYACILVAAGIVLIPVSVAVSRFEPDAYDPHRAA